MPSPSTTILFACVATTCMLSVACKSKDSLESYSGSGPVMSGPILPPEPTASSAGNHDDEIKVLFEETDKNGDGKVTREETKIVADTKFAEIDTDKNGVLDASELALHAEREFAKRAAERIKELDRNGDGKLSRDEAAPGMLARFDKFDRDKDGAISLQEVMQVTSPGGSRRSPLTALDTDGDGRVTESEHSRARTEWFDRADTDHDGAVTIEEAKAAVPAGPTPARGRQSPGIGVP